MGTRYYVPRKAVLELVKKGLVELLPDQVIHHMEFDDNYGCEMETNEVKIHYTRVAIAGWEFTCSTYMGEKQSKWFIGPNIGKPEVSEFLKRNGVNYSFG